MQFPLLTWPYRQSRASRMISLHSSSDNLAESADPVIRFFPNETISLYDVILLRDLKFELVRGEIPILKLFVETDNDSKYLH